MSNPEGTPIWYELLTNDAAKATRFYETVMGWKVQPAPPGGMDYRMLDTGKGFVGGLMELNADMRAKGGKPTWLFYIGVNDVDATVTKATAAGAKVLMEAFDLPNVGRMAMLADPQGNPFYVMRGASNADSTAFERQGMGKCNWNELATANPTAALAFYEKVFGWTFPNKMPMPTGGDYALGGVAGTAFAGVMAQPPGAPAGWQFYFRTPDINAAVTKVKEAGGKVHVGPMEVPGGDQVIMATDPEGNPFGVAAPGKA